METLITSFFLSELFSAKKCEDIFKKESIELKLCQEIRNKNKQIEEQRWEEMKQILKDFYETLDDQAKNDLQQNIDKIPEKLKIEFNKMVQNKKNMLKEIIDEINLKSSNNDMESL